MMTQEEYLKLQAVCRYMYRVVIGRTQCVLEFTKPCHFLVFKESFKSEAEFAILEYSRDKYREV